MGHKMDLISLFYSSLRANVISFDYRGYGSSTGKPSERGIQADVEAVIKYALNCPIIDKNKIFLYGKSLGGAVAVSGMTTYQDKIQGLIIENTFACMDDVVRDITHLPSCIVSTLLRSHWPSIDRIGWISRPVMVICGDCDELVNCENSKHLFAAADSAKFKDFYLVKGGNHAKTYKVNTEEYVARIGGFMNKVLTKYPIAQ